MTERQWEKGLISIILVTLDDQEELLDKALFSIYCNTYTNVEVILVHHGRSFAYHDASLKPLVEKYSELTIQLIHYEQFADVGFGKSKNIGIQHAKGQYLYFMADHWVLFPQHFETLLSQLGNKAWSYSLFQIQKESSFEHGPYIDLMYRYNSPAAYSFQQLADRNYIPLPVVLFDRTRLEPHTTIEFREDLLVYEDYILLLNLAMQYEPAFCNELLVSCRIQADRKDFFDETMDFLVGRYNSDIYFQEQNQVLIAEGELRSLRDEIRNSHSLSASMPIFRKNLLLTGLMYGLLILYSWATGFYASHGQNEGLAAFCQLINSPLVQGNLFWIVFIVTSGLYWKGYLLLKRINRFPGHLIALAYAFVGLVTTMVYPIFVSDPVGDATRQINTMPVSQLLHFSFLSPDTGTVLLFGMKGLNLLLYAAMGFAIYSVARKLKFKNPALSVYAFAFNPFVLLFYLGNGNLGFLSLFLVLEALALAAMEVDSFVIPMLLGAGLINAGTLILIPPTLIYLCQKRGWRLSLTSLAVSLAGVGSVILACSNTNTLAGALNLSQLRQPVSTYVLQYVQQFLHAFMPTDTHVLNLYLAFGSLFVLAYGGYYLFRAWNLARNAEPMTLRQYAKEAVQLSLPGVLLPGCPIFMGMTLLSSLFLGEWSLFRYVAIAVTAIPLGFIANNHMPSLYYFLFFCALSTILFIRWAKKVNLFNLYTQMEQTYESFLHVETMVISKSFVEASGQNNVPVDVIIPVYNALDEVKKCIESISKSKLKNVRVIIIDDKSTDPNVVPYLKQIEGKLPFDHLILYNPKNLGFIKTCNIGMRYSRNDVILLNSDTMVEINWVERLRELAYRDRYIATVTPVTNNGTITSVPGFCVENPFPKDLQIDDVASFLYRTSNDLLVRIPTPVGFCMYIKQEILDRVGVFDESYRVGYCDENDLGERAKAMGYWHALAPNTFVFHRPGSVSFGKQRKKLFARNAKLLERRYPDYFPEVASFVQANPLRGLQDKVYQFYRSETMKRRKKILYVVHADPFQAVAGGTEFHVSDLVQKLKYDYFFCVAMFKRDGILVKEIFDDFNREYHFDFPIKIQFDEMNIGFDSIFSQTALHDPHMQYQLRDIMYFYNFDIVHIHHLIRGSFDFISVAKQMGKTVMLTMHDYYLICPTVNLLTPEKQFCGIDNRNFTKCATCVGSHLYHEREVIQPFLDQIDLVLFPSQEAKNIVCSVYDIANSEVIEHGVVPDSHEKNGTPATNGGGGLDLLSAGSKLPMVWASGGNKKLKLLFLGTAGPMKGTDFVIEILKHYRPQLPQAGLEFHMLGSEGTYKSQLEPFVEEKVLIAHGGYNRGSIKECLDTIDPDLVCILSNYPETYCYTLTEAVSSGYPVLVSPLGALPERVKALDCGFVLEQYTLEAFTSKIAGLLQDKKPILDLKNQIKNLHIRSSEEMAEDYKKLYARIPIAMKQNYRLIAADSNLNKIKTYPQIWDYSRKRLKVPVAQVKQLLFENSISQTMSQQHVYQSLHSGKPMSLIRIGEKELTLLAMKNASDEELRHITTMMPLCGIDPHNIPSPEEFANLILKADFVCCHNPAVTNQPEVLGPTLDGLLKWDLLEKRQFIEFHTVYNMAASGYLFSALWGKKVVIVGAKAEPFYYYYMNHPHYRDAFPFLGLENITVVGLVTTPDLPSCSMNFRKTIEEQVRNTYASQPDVFLFATGMLSRYLAVMVKNDGYVGLDIGNTLESMMNWKNKRPCMELFHEYRHPDYEFLYNPEHGYLEETRKL